MSRTEADGMERETELLAANRLGSVREMFTEDFAHNPYDLMLDQTDTLGQLNRRNSSFAIALDDPENSFISPRNNVFSTCEDAHRGGSYTAQYQYLAGVEHARHVVKASEE